MRLIQVMRQHFVRILFGTTFILLVLALPTHVNPLRINAQQTPSATASVTERSTITPSDDPVLVGAGDIASCALDTDEKTAKLLDNIPGTVFTMGDNTYPGGSAADYQACYGPTWGRHAKRTRPSPGNHDYVARGAAPYFAYFGANAGPAGRGYYSYDLGAWHLISLDSDIAAYAGSPQESWLRDDLSKTTAQCILAYWHHPMYSSGLQPDRPRDVPVLYQTLYNFGASVVVNGHVHYYERFAPLDPSGHVDTAHGIREFIVGTGGAGLNTRFLLKQSSSEVLNNTTWGVIKFTLHATSYDWEFIPVQGGTFRDAGTGQCLKR